MGRGGSATDQTSPPPRPPDSQQIPYLEYNGLIVFPQVEGKYVSVHERLSTLAEYVDGFLEKLDFNPRHVVLLHRFHAFLDAGIQLQTQQPTTPRLTVITRSNNIKYKQTRKKGCV